VSHDALDLLLVEARAPEPSDDGFTEIVMQGIRTGGSVWRHPRFLTRPVVLVAAAVLATGGALAAAARINTLANEHRASVAASTSRPPSGPSRVAPGSVVVNQDSKPSSSPRGAVASAPKKLQHFSNADYEWGYTSAHAAYLLDRRTGLRLVTEMYTNAFATKHAHKITLTLTNTGAQPLGITSQSGCALSAAAWPGRATDGSASPQTSKDPSSAKSWECGGGGDPRGVSGENFILGPGDTHTENIALVLRGAGDWTVVGVCRCEIVAPPDTTSPTPLDGVQQLIVSGTAQAGPQPTTNTRLVTPPLGGRVR
jgi:hypothetical protein